MYMALKSMKYRKDDLSVGNVEAGQEVPGFEKWDHWTKKALMDQKMVRWSDTGKMAPDEEAAAARVVHQPLPNGPLGPVPTEVAPIRDERLFKEALPDIKSAVVDSQAAPELEPEINPLFQAAAAKPVDSRIVVTTEPVGPVVLSCEACGKVGFKDANGLRIHQARVHKDILSKEIS